MLSSTWILVWIAVTVAAWWLPASVAFLILVLNLLIADPIPYVDEIAMFAITFKQALEEWLKKRKQREATTQTTETETEEVEHLLEDSDKSNKPSNAD